jgi:hypothetical protein
VLASPRKNRPIKKGARAVGLGFFKGVKILIARKQVDLPLHKTELRLDEKIRLTRIFQTISIFPLFQQK